jgi:hypothetical protein
MASRIWLAAAFVIAFGASPAHPGTGAAASQQWELLTRGPAAVLQNGTACVSFRRQPGPRVKIESGDDPNPCAKAGERIA